MPPPKKYVNFCSKSQGLYPIPNFVSKIFLDKLSGNFGHKALISRVCSEIHVPMMHLIIQAIPPPIQEIQMAFPDP